MTFIPEGDPNRPLDADAVYYIRLWYLGEYNGARALRRLTIPEICDVTHRSEEKVRAALGSYLNYKGGHP